MAGVAKEPKLASQPTYHGLKLSASPPMLENRCVLCNGRHSDGFPWLFSCCISRRRTFLIQAIKVDEFLYSDLEGEGILGKRAISQIQHKADDYDQVEELLKKLERCDNSKFNAFLRALALNGSEEVARTLWNHFYAAMQVEIDLWSQDIIICTPDFHAVNRKHAYPMTSKPRGTALIINIFETANMSIRYGSDIDAKYLKKLFDKLSFKVVSVSDTTSAGMLDTIKATMANTKETDQCFILFTMSHGGLNFSDQEVIYGSDGTDGAEVTKKSILDLVCNDADYPQLRDKPRLVFFEACRGEKEELRMKEMKNSAEYCRPHLMCAHSSSKDHVSYSNAKLGARFVRAFYETVARKSHDTDLVSLMEEVKQQTKVKDDAGSHEQIPEFFHDPNMKEKKKFFFFPGITE